MIQNVALILAIFAQAPQEVAGLPEPFAIEVVDKATDRGVPLVELTTVNNVRFVTDSNGLVAVAEPDLTGLSVFFHVKSHGYEFAKDGFGIRGKALDVRPGGKARLELTRLNVAERLYRTTGGGIYRDSVILGRPVPARAPLLAAKVFGCDSVMTAEYRDKIFWFWGDTNKPSYPLGHFHMTGATTPRRGLEPDKTVDYTYFVGEDGFARPTCQMPGEGPTWIGGLTVVKDHSGRDRMYAGYVKIRPPMEAYEHGLVVWDDTLERFTKVVVYPEGLPIYPGPQGHAFHHAGPDGQDYVYFTTFLPLTRVKADPDALADPRRFEGFTCLVPGTRAADRRVERDEKGAVVYGWKPNTPPLTCAEQSTFLKAGVLKPGEALVALRDVETGRPIVAHNASVYWNDHRRRWVWIGSEQNGATSFLGDVWYAEADSPTGPWVYARKVVTHDKYSFYNPKRHAFLDKGSVVYFEGTYTNSFSGNPDQTPRYDYNQVMYRLDLDDPRLILPAPVRDDSGGQIPFFALERPREGTVAVYATPEKGGRALSITPPAAGATAAFHALPVEPGKPPANTALLHEFTAEGRRVYSTAESLPGLRRADKPLCRVWSNPIALDFPAPPG